MAAIIQEYNGWLLAFDLGIPAVYTKAGSGAIQGNFVSLANAFLVPVSSSSSGNVVVNPLNRSITTYIHTTSSNALVAKNNGNGSVVGINCIPTLSSSVLEVQGTALQDSIVLKNVGRLIGSSTTAIISSLNAVYAYANLVSASSSYAVNANYLNATIGTLIGTNFTLGAGTAVSLSVTGGTFVNLSVSSAILTNAFVNTLSASGNTSLQNVTGTLATFNRVTTSSAVLTNVSAGIVSASSGVFDNLFVTGITSLTAITANVITTSSAVLTNVSAGIVSASSGVFNNLFVTGIITSLTANVITASSAILTTSIIDSLTANSIIASSCNVNGITSMVAGRCPENIVLNINAAIPTLPEKNTLNLDIDSSLGTRSDTPNAYLGLGEKLISASSSQTANYLLDLWPDGKRGGQTSGVLTNYGCVGSSTLSVMVGRIKVRINGRDLYMPLYSS